LKEHALIKVVMKILCHMTDVFEKTDYLYNNCFYFLKHYTLKYSVISVIVSFVIGKIGVTLAVTLPISLLKCHDISLHQIREVRHV